MKNSSSMWHPVGSSSGSINTNQGSSLILTEEELDRQYRTYKTQFEEWIEKNRHHPDREAYNQYVNQFKEWEAQVEANRQAIREWKNSKGAEHASDQQSLSKRKVNEPAATSSAVTSPSQSNTEKKKEKKKKKRKTTEETGSAVNNEGENPMMAMMKMMATMAGAQSTTPVPPAPMDPFSMMMTMTMMSTMLMNSAPPQPAAPTTMGPMSTTVPTNATPVLPDLTKPPPGFIPPADDYSRQMDRDRAFRSERAQCSPDHAWERRQLHTNDLDGQRSRGDYWYQRWLTNRHNQQPATVDPWLPSHRPSQSAVPTATGPTPLWAAQASSAVSLIRPNLDRNPHQLNQSSAPYISRSHFGSKDFSMRKQNQRQWE